MASGKKAVNFAEILQRKIKFHALPVKFSELKLWQI